jgi:hypothetical protein
MTVTSSSTIGSSGSNNTYSDNPKSNKESTKYANLVERFLSHYYPAMRTAPHPKEVAKVVLESVKGSVVSPRQQANNNFFRYPVGEDAKLYADAKRKMSDSELRSFVAKMTLS